MARTKLTAEQKAMLLALPIKEKDKLLLRLIAKDPMLVEQLSFQHLEAATPAATAAATDDRAAEVREYIAAALDKAYGISPGELMMQLRYVSGQITKHVRVTKDKLGEVQLWVEAMYTALDHHLRRMQKRYSSSDRWDKFAEYIVKRLVTVMNKASKLHPDLWLEFQPQLNEVLIVIHDTPQLRGSAERHGLPRRWEGA